MKIVLNNRNEEFAGDQYTVSEIFKEMSFTFPRVIVKLNGRLIKKPQYPETIVTNGDNLEVIHLISGG